MRVPRVVIAGDINAHTERWNLHTKKRVNVQFWEGLVEEHELVIWNSEEGTRAGPRTEKTSIIDLTLSSPAVALNWCLLQEEATGSDHEVIMWEVLRGKEGGKPGKTVTGWDISGSKGKGKEEEERKKAEEKARRAEDMFRQLMRDTRLDDESTKEQISGMADRLRAAMTETLDRHAVQKRWCSRSKRWWTDELLDLRKTHGRVRLRKDWEAVRVAKRDQRREIRR